MPSTYARDARRFLDAARRREDYETPMLHLRDGYDFDRFMGLFITGFTPREKQAARESPLIADEDDFALH